MYVADGGGGGAVVGTAVGKIADSMSGFARAAADGGFEVNEAGGEALIRAIDDFQNWIDSKSTDAMLLEQRRKLGGGQGGQTMAPFVQQVARDDQGFLTQLRALGESLDKAKEGIQKAMQNYRETDAAGGAAVRQAGISV